MSQHCVFYDMSIDAFMSVYKDEDRNFAVDWITEEFYYVVFESNVQALMENAEKWRRDPESIPRFITTRDEAVAKYFAQLPEEEFDNMMIVPSEIVRWANLSSGAIGADILEPDFKRAEKVGKWL